MPSACMRSTSRILARHRCPYEPSRIRRGHRAAIRTRAQQNDAAESGAKPGAQVAGPPPPKPGPPPPKGAEAASSSGSNGTGAATQSEGDEPSLATAEQLLEAIRAGDTEAAEELASEVVAEQDALAAAVESAEADTKAAKKTLDQLKDQYRRLQADFDNFRSRAEAEKTQTGKDVKMSVVQDLLPLVDNFELAASQIKPANEAEEKINNSYQGLYRQMVDIFRGMGLEAVPTVGSQFNPETHDGIMKEDSETEADGTILEEFRKGFMFNGKLLRPAMVKVAVNSKPSTESDNDNLGAPSEQADAADAA